MEKSIPRIIFGITRLASDDNQCSGGGGGGCPDPQFPSLDWPMHQMKSGVR